MQTRIFWVAALVAAMSVCTPPAWSDFGPKDGAVIGIITGTDSAMNAKEDHSNLKPDFTTTSFIEVELGKVVNLDIKDISVKRNEYSQALKYKGWTGAKNYGKLGDIEASKIIFHEAQGHSFFIDWGYKDSLGKPVTSGWAYQTSFPHKYPRDGVYTVAIKMMQSGIKHQWYELGERVQKTTTVDKSSAWADIPVWFQYGINGSGEGDHWKDFDFKKPTMYFVATAKGTATAAKKPMGIYKRYVHCGEWGTGNDEARTTSVKADYWDESKQMPVNFEAFTRVDWWRCDPPWEDTWWQLWAQLDAKGVVTGYEWSSVTTKYSELAATGKITLIHEPLTGKVPLTYTAVPASAQPEYFLQDLYEGFIFNVAKKDTVFYKDSDVTFVISDIKDPATTQYVSHTDPSYVAKSMIISVYRPLPPVSGSSFGLTLSPTVDNSTKSKIVHGEEDKPVSVLMGDIGLHINGKKKDMGNYNVWDQSINYPPAGGINAIQKAYPSWGSYNTNSTQYAKFWKTKGYGWYKAVSGNNAANNPKYQGSDCYQYYYDQYYGDINLYMHWGDGSVTSGRINQPHVPYELKGNNTTGQSVAHVYNKNGRYDGWIYSAYANLYHQDTNLVQAPVAQYRWEARRILHKDPYNVLVNDWGYVRRWTWNSPYVRIAWSAWNWPRHGGGWWFLGYIYQ